MAARMATFARCLDRGCTGLRPDCTECASGGYPVVTVGAHRAFSRFRWTGAGSGMVAHWSQLGERGVIVTYVVAIYIYPGVEVLDFAGPYEVFTTANRVFARQYPAEEAPFEVFTIASRQELIRARAGLQIKPDFIRSRHPAIDVLIVPGGVVMDELRDSELSCWLADIHRRTQLTASVCTGAFLLAKGGILDGLSATTHHEDIADLREMFPGVQVLENRRWVDQGKVVTSGGISAGIDMSLHLIERLASRALALATACQLEVDWPAGQGEWPLTASRTSE